MSEPDGGLAPERVLQSPRRHEPADALVLPHELQQRPHGTAGPTELEVTVEYRGSHETHYATRIVATKESGRAWAYTAEEVG